MSRKKETVTTIDGRDELEQVMGEYAAAYIERERMLLDMEAEINAVRQRYEAAIASHTETCDGLFEDIQAWAVLNPGAFKDKKSLALLHGTVGFRTSPPAVKQVKGVKSEHTLSRLHACGEMGYVRVKQEVDKDAILAAFAEHRTDNDKLSVFGLVVEQVEKFYADVNHEKISEGRG